MFWIGLAIFGFGLICGAIGMVLLAAIMVEGKQQRELGGWK